MDLEAALSQFDRTAANLDLLDDIWGRYEECIPDGIVFGLDTAGVDRLRMDFDEVVASLPSIDGWSASAGLMPLDDIAQSRAEIFSASLGPLAERDLSDEVESARREIAHYRQLFTQKRRSLVRRHVDRLVSEVDAILAATEPVAGGREFNGMGSWVELRQRLAEFDRLIGAELPSGTRRSDLARHIHFAEANDLFDIVEMDWPSVRAAALDLVFEGEPFPVKVADLGELLDERQDEGVEEPEGPTSATLESPGSERVLPEGITPDNKKSYAEIAGEPIEPTSADSVDEGLKDLTAHTLSEEDNPNAVPQAPMTDGEPKSEGSEVLEIGGQAIIYAESAPASHSIERSTGVKRLLPNKEEGRGIWFNMVAGLFLLILLAVTAIGLDAFRQSQASDADAGDRTTESELAGGELPDIPENQIATCTEGGAALNWDLATIELVNAYEANGTRKSGEVPLCGGKRLRIETFYEGDVKPQLLDEHVRFREHCGASDNGMPVRLETEREGVWLGSGESVSGEVLLGFAWNPAVGTVTSQRQVIWCNTTPVFFESLGSIQFTISVVDPLATEGTEN